ncbi:MAG: NUDIX hydrolase [Anaerolineae bacterium]|nr:NUDIX hydrolase [Anaerolineae bacterium]
MDRTVEILSKTLALDSIFTVERVTLRHRHYDGTMGEPILRLNLERGDSVAVLLHDRATDTIILTEQFRYSTYAKGPGWLLELPAGGINPGEDPAAAARRELVEETGYTLKAGSLRHISTFYVSPGGTSERIHLYYAAVTPQDRAGSGGGAAGEDEDIRVLVRSVNEALAQIGDGTIQDAKTIIGLLWLQAYARAVS